MAKLVVSLDGMVEGHFFLDKERFTMGRTPTSDIFLDHPGVSNLHAVIVTMSNDHVLEDLSSTNGTVVNGEKITKHILQNNDVIELGMYQLKYINQRATSDMDFDKTMISTVAFAETDQLSEKPLLATAVSSARSVKTSFPLGGVKYLNGERSGQDVIIDAPLKTFGESHTQAMMISRRPHGYYVTHVVGRKIPKVNGKSIGTQPVLLQDKDRVSMAEVQLEFFLQPDQ